MEPIPWCESPPESLPPSASMSNQQPVSSNPPPQESTPPIPKPGNPVGVNAAADTGPKPGAATGSPPAGTPAGQTATKPTGLPQEKSTAGAIKDTAATPGGAQNPEATKTTNPPGQANTSPANNEASNWVMKIIAGAAAFLTAARAAEAPIEISGLILPAGDAPATLALTEAGAWAGPAGGVLGAFAGGFIAGNLLMDAFPAIGTAPADWLAEKIYGH